MQAGLQRPAGGRREQAPVPRGCQVMAPHDFSHLLQEAPGASSGRVGPEGRAPP